MAHIKGNPVAKVIDMMEEVRGKCLVKERDNKNFKENTKAEEQNTSEYIQTLRTTNAQKRVEFMESMKTDLYMIREVLAGRPECMVGLTAANASEAIENLHQKVCMARRRYDDLTNRLKKRQDVLAELDTKNSLVSTYEAKFFDPEQTTRLRGLYNDIEKAKIRFEAATAISKKYEALKDVLKKEARWYPSRLAAISELIDVANHEMKVLKDLEEQATAGITRSAKELAEMEKVCHDARHVRDEELRAARAHFAPKDTDQCKIRPHAKVVPDYLYRDREIKAAYAMRVRAETLLELQKIFVRLEKALKACGQEDVLHAYQRLGEIKARLLDKLERHLVFRDGLQTQLNELSSKADLVKYGGRYPDYVKRYSMAPETSEDPEDADDTEPIPTTKPRFSLKNCKRIARWSKRASLSAKRRRESSTYELEVKVKDAQERLQTARRLYSDREQLLADIQYGIAVHFAKLKGIKLKPPLENFSTDHPLDDLLTIHRKLALLYEQVKDSEEFESVDRRKLIEHRKLFEILHGMVPLSSIYTTAEIAEVDDDDYSITDVDNENYYTRADIKHMGNSLIEEKTRPKRVRKTAQRGSRR